MSSTSVPQTFIELVTDLLNRVRQDTNTALSVPIAKRAINSALVDMHVGTSEHFDWAIKRAVLKTHPVFNSGTLTVTQAGNVQLVGLANQEWVDLNVHGQPNGRAGGKLVINGATTVYEIQGISFSVLASITPSYLGETDTGVEFTYFEDEYDLASDFLRPLNLLKFSDEMEIGLIGLRDFRTRYPRNNIPSDYPRVATIVTRNFAAMPDVKRVIFHPPPSTVIAIPYDYITSNLAVDSTGARQMFMVADDDEPIVPKHLRTAIVLHALASWYRDRKNDTRSQEVRDEYVEFVNRIIGDTAIGAQKTRLEVRNASYRRRAARPWRGSGTRRYDTNGRFDRLED